MMRKLMIGCGLSALLASTALATPAPMTISTGQKITPTAAAGSVFTPLNPHLATEPNYTVGQAETTLVSPDGKTMLVLTSGYNLNQTPSGATDPLTSTEYRLCLRHLCRRARADASAAGGQTLSAESPGRLTAHISMSVAARTTVFMFLPSAAMVSPKPVRR